MRSLCCACLLAAGCGVADSSVDLKPVETALVAGASIGHASSIAAASMGGATACATVTQPCSASYPCDGATTLTLGDACPLPLGGVGTGSVVVSGTWTAADAATLKLMFGVAIGKDKVAVSQAVGVSVHSAMGQTTVAYTGQDVTVDGGDALAAQSSWTVTVDDKGTPGDPSDDVYTLAGAQQGASTGAGGQVTLSGVVLDPSCRKNPVAGNAVIQEVSSTSIEQATVSFHAACDGKVDTAGGFGGTAHQDLVLFP